MNASAIASFLFYSFLFFRHKNQFKFLNQIVLTLKVNIFLLFVDVVQNVELERENVELPMA